MYKKNKQVDKHGPAHGHMDTQDQEMDIRKIMKDVENFGYSHTSWKQRKRIEDKKVVSLGGKVSKMFVPSGVMKQYKLRKRGRKNFILSSVPYASPKAAEIAFKCGGPRMKKQKEREQRMLQERVILGQVGGKLGDSSKRSVGKRRPEGRGLKSSEGRFKNGVLNVKHLIHPAQSKDQATQTYGPSGVKREKGNNKRGKKHRCVMISSCGGRSFAGNEATFANVSMCLFEITYLRVIRSHLRSTK